MMQVDIHGKLVSEAEIEIELFIKEAYKRRESNVLVIHGHGEYKLKKSVAIFCSNSPLVESFSDAPTQIGGSGATLINIKTKR